MVNREAYYAIMQSNDNFILMMFGVTLMGMVASQRIGFLNTLTIPRLRLWMIMAIAILIRLPYLSESYWYDETFTSAMIRLPFNQLGEAILYDVHPPLAYLPFWIWARLFGDSDMMLRLPSLIMGVVSIWLAYGIAYYVKPEYALWGAGAVALLPTHLIYSTEARAYMLLTILVMVCILAIIEDRPAWFLWGALLPYVHAHGLIYLAILSSIWIANIFQRVRCFECFGYSKRNMYRWIANRISPLIFILTMLPMAMIIIKLQSSDVADGFWLRDMGLGGVLALLPNILIGGRFIPILAFILIPLVFYVVIKSSIAMRDNPTVRILLVVSIAMPLLTAITAWITGLNIILMRAMIPTAVLWAIIIVTYKPRLFVTMVIIPLVYGIIPDYQRMDIRSIVSDCAGSDVVYAVNTTTAIMAWHYLDNVMVAPDSNDMNQYYPVELFGIPRARWDDVHGDVCVLYLDSPMGYEHHREFVHSLSPYMSWVHQTDDYTQYHVYRVKK